MTRSMLAAIAEAAGLDDYEKPQPAAASFRQAPKPAAAAAPELSLPEQIVQTWKTDPAIRAEFGSLSTYAAWRRHDAAQSAGVSIAQIDAQYPDVSGYISQLEKKNGSVSGSEKSAIGTFAETWRGSADIRAEFRSFECYAAYMRAKANGLVKHYGQGNVR